MLLNPALTASWNDIQLTLQQKQQWQSLEAFSTSGLAFEIKASRFNWEKMDRMTAVYKKKLMKGLAFGINVYSDRAGDASMRTNNINLGIAYHERIDELNAISAGIIGGIIQSSISADKLRWNNQYGAAGYDPNINPNENFDASRIYPDFGTGLLWTYGKVSRTISANNETNIHAGISVMHINRPNQSFLGGEDRMHMRFTVHSAATFALTNTNIALCPSLLVMKQGKQKEITAGFLFKFNMKESSKITGFKKGSSFSTGCYYRYKDAIVPYVGFEFSAYSFGFSYDVNISGLTTVTSARGGIEVTFRIANPAAFLYQNKTKASFN
jgi:type IX secretion system PorP/SprF family membrane protein